jgi:hypothetical protein
MLPSIHQDTINQIEVDHFANTVTQKTSLSNSTQLTYPGKLGRVAACFQLESHADMALCRQRAEDQLGVCAPPHTRSMRPQADILSAFHITHGGITLILSRNGGVHGSVLRADGSHYCHYSCSTSWLLSIGATDDFQRVYESVVCVCVCLSLLVMPTTPSAGPAPPCPISLILDPCDSVCLSSFSWGDSPVLSSVAVDRCLSLPPSFECVPTSGFGAEWTGMSCGSVSLREWADLYHTTAARDSASWDNWHEHVTQACAHTLRDCDVCVANVRLPPSGACASRVPTTQLDLDRLEHAVHNLACGMRAQTCARGCRLQFPQELNLPSLMVTSNGCFDSSLFPRTAQLQADLISLVLIACAPHNYPSAPSAITPSVVNSTL